MVLAAAIGLGLQAFASVSGALLPALLIGLLAASLVPVRGGCPVARPPRRPEP